MCLLICVDLGVIETKCSPAFDHIPYEKGKRKSRRVDRRILYCTSTQKHAKHLHLYSFYLQSKALTNASFYDETNDKKSLYMENFLGMF